jgi:hypothetical protein
MHFSRRTRFSRVTEMKMKNIKIDITMWELNNQIVFFNNTSLAHSFWSSQPKPLDLLPSDGESSA